MLVIYTLILTCMGLQQAVLKPAKSPKNSDYKNKANFLQFQMNIDKLIKEYETEFLKQVARTKAITTGNAEISPGTKSQAKGTTK